jgi:hypothetical protein
MASTAASAVKEGIHQLDAGSFSLSCFGSIVLDVIVLSHRLGLKAPFALVFLAAIEADLAMFASKRPYGGLVP